MWARDFLGGPIVKTLHSQCRGHGFSPWLENKDSACYMAWLEKKKIGGQIRPKLQFATPISDDFLRSLPAVGCNEKGQWLPAERRGAIYLHSSSKLIIFISIREYSLISGDDAPPSLQVLPYTERWKYHAILQWVTDVDAGERRAVLDLIM